MALKAKDAHSSEGCDLRHGRKRSMEIALCGMQEYLVDDAIQSNCGVIVAYESICSWTVHGRSGLSFMPKCSSIGFVARMQSTSKTKEDDGRMEMIRSRKKIRRDQYRLRASTHFSRRAIVLHEKERRGGNDGERRMLWRALDTSRLAHVLGEQREEGYRSNTILLAMKIHCKQDRVHQ